MDLKDFFHEHKKVALGFSGGVDSCYLLYEAVQQGAEVKPYFVKTAFQPEFELEDAKKVANQLGVKLHIINYDVLEAESVVTNPADRCYHCKRRIFGAIQKQALADGYTVLLDGTNASDQVEDRPGMKALQELKVLSPLRQCGLTKQEIRLRSQEAGLFTWDKPAYACLATRIPTGDRITGELLERVEAAEKVLAELGFYDYRVRVYHEAARIQLPENQMRRALELREQIHKAIKPYFDIVLLDFEAR